MKKFLIIFNLIWVVVTFLIGITQEYFSEILFDTENNLTPMNLVKDVMFWIIIGIILLGNALIIFLQTKLDNNKTKDIFDFQSTKYIPIKQRPTRKLAKELVSEVNREKDVTRFDEVVFQRKEVDLLYDYTKYYDIKPIISYDNPKILKIETQMDCFEMHIEDNDFVMNGNQGFVMALFSYVPAENWSRFFGAEYFLEFDAVGTGDIIAFQLEIKDEKRNKIFDKKYLVNNKGEHIKIWLPSVTRDASSWINISELCFTIFGNDAYFTGKSGVLTIKRLRMVPR